MKPGLLTTPELAAIKASPAIPTALPGIPLTRDRTERNFEYNAFKFKVLFSPSNFTPRSSSKFVQPHTQHIE